MHLAAIAKRSQAMKRKASTAKNGEATCWYPLGRLEGIAYKIGYDEFTKNSPEPKPAPDGNRPIAPLKILS